MAAEKSLDWERDVGTVRIPLRGKLGAGKYALVDGDYDGEYLSSFVWLLNPAGYVIRSDWVDGVRKTVYLHRLVAGSARGKWVDHINRDKLDNRSRNLRLVTPSENAFNRPQGKMPRSKSGYRGVRHTVRYGVTYGTFYLVFQGKYRGAYRTATEAARAYDELARAAYGKDAVLNFPIGKA